MWMISSTYNDGSTPPLLLSPIDVSDHKMKVFNVFEFFQVVVTVFQVVQGKARF